MAWVSFFLEIGVMSANLILKRSFLELVKSDVKVSAKNSDEIYKIFDVIILKVVAFLLLIELISFSTSAFITSLKQNKVLRNVFANSVFDK